MVLLSAQGMRMAAIAKVPKFTLAQRREIKKTAKVPPSGPWPAFLDVEPAEDDPPLHHLAQHPRLRPTAPPGRHQGKRCLKRH
ncbi:MAG TPA: hypothetical protein VIP48_16535 [Streptosporangiaceae bacterium]